MCAPRILTQEHVPSGRTKELVACTSALRCTHASSSFVRTLKGPDLLGTIKMESSNIREQMSQGGTCTKRLTKSFCSGGCWLVHVKYIFDFCSRPPNDNIICVYNLLAFCNLFRSPRNVPC